MSQILIQKESFKKRNSKKVTVNYLKQQLRQEAGKCGGTKFELELRLYSCLETKFNQFLFQKSSQETWRVDEVRNIAGHFFDLETNDWTPLWEAKLRASTVIQRDLGTEAGQDPQVRSYWQKCYEFLEQFNCSVPMNRVVSSDEIQPAIRKLLYVPVSKWNQAHSTLLIETFKGVRHVNASTSDSVQDYIKLVGTVPEFYKLHPDVQAQIDPHIVIADFGIGVPAGWAAAVAAYPPRAVPPPGYAAVPAPSNPNNAGVGGADQVWPFATGPQAQHFIGFLQGRIAGARFIYCPGLPLAPLVF